MFGITTQSVLNNPYVMFMLTKQNLRQENKFKRNQHRNVRRSSLVVFGWLAGLWLGFTHLFFIRTNTLRTVKLTRTSNWNKHYEPWNKNYLKQIYSKFYWFTPFKNDFKGLSKPSNDKIWKFNFFEEIVTLCFFLSFYNFIVLDAKEKDSFQLESIISNQNIKNITRKGIY